MTGRIIPVVTLLAVIGCKTETGTPPLFTKLPPEYTGIQFENTIPEADFQTFTEFPYLYNGGGVALGDITNNGLPDVFLTGNMVSSRLYLNKGDFRFEDITERAGVTTNRWVTGASMVDITNNGYLDIYVSVTGMPGSGPEERANMLFINNGDLTFTESAADYGIAHTGHTTHAAFFDYNGSGYLDLFLLNNSPVSFSRKGGSPFHVPDDPDSYDALYRNNGDGTFTDVSNEAGILRSTGYGLGVAVTDFNRNGRPDIYVSNDNVPNDVLYINNGDGTFSNMAGSYLKQTSFSGMGVDAADFTNNGMPELMQTDMMPEAINERKRMSGGNTYSRFRNQRIFGLDYYYPKNTLQLNHGTDRDGHILFSDIARIAGTAYTDWSWSALFGDYNNSGYKDIMVTNGYPKDVINHEYLISLDAIPVANLEAGRNELFRQLHDINVPNYLFKNTGGLVFVDVSSAWGFRDPGYSYGAAHADLNNNGRLDIVINNIDAPASVYRNDGDNGAEAHYLQIRLEGDYPNRQGLGAELTLYNGESQQYIYHNVHRGYQSTVDDRVHFGLGSKTAVDSLVIVWPDRRRQVLRDIGADRMITIRQSDAYDNTGHVTESDLRYFFEPVAERIGIDYRHTDKRFVDFMVQPTLPYKKSRSGPPMAVADVTGNGLDDLFVGGSGGHQAVLYLQNNDGTFTESAPGQPWEKDHQFEDAAVLFFDANGNGLPDLYVASGGYHLSPGSSFLQDRLYINRGNGRFARDRHALPVIFSSGATVTAADFTGNGMTDLFIGGGVFPRKYPDHSKSILLRNEGGWFTDVTTDYAPELADAGIITDALWFDYNNNGLPDLVTAGIWQPVRIYENDGTNLKEVTSEAGLENTRGWWYSLAKGDFNGDGHTDLIAGNLGLNHTFTTSENQRFGVYAHDFDYDLTVDILYVTEQNGSEYPFFGLFKLGQSIVFTGGPSGVDCFAEAPVDRIFSKDQLEQAIHYQADTFASMQFRNNRDGTFEPIPLPDMAQISPVNSVVVHDIDDDGIPDLLIAGNSFKTDPDIPRADAGKGLWLRNDGEGRFLPVSPVKSGFLAPYDARNLVLIETPEGYLVVVANNEGPLQLFRIIPRQNQYSHASGSGTT